MAFTFQINDQVKFDHDDKLLAKASKLKPTIYTNEVNPKRLVKVIEDKTKLDGVGIEKVDEISDLPKHQLKRDDSLIIDFGKHYVGKFNIDIKKVGSPQDAPLTLKLKFAEVPAEFAYDSADYDGWLSKSWIQEEVIHLDHLPVNLKLPRRYAFRYVQIKVVDTSPKWAAVFSNPQVIAVSSASNQDLSQFSIKSQELQVIYDTSVKTLHDCMQEVFEDGPKRDRRLWLGDLRLQALANYATFNNTDLVKRCLYLFAATTAQDGRIVANVFTDGKVQPDDTFLLDYSMFFISTLTDYYQQTKDQEALSDMYPIAKKQVDYALKFIDSDGQFKESDDYPVFIDWSNEFDKTTSGQAVLIYTLKQFLVLATEYGDQDVKKIKQVLERLVTYTKSNLFDHETGLFVSGPDHELNISSQIWMVLAGVVTGEQAKQVMLTTKERLFPVTGIATPYMYHHITEAFLCAGLTNEGIKLLKDYWGKMIKLGADTYWEAFEPEDPDYSPYGSPIVSSYCHAWGCTPAYLIKRYLIEKED